MVQIEYIRHGVAHRIPGKILINEVLKKNPKLHDYVLQHELKHTEPGKNTLAENIKHDFKPNIKNDINLFLFELEHPSCWSQFIPVLYYKKKLYWDVSLLLVYAFAVMCFLTLFFIIYTTLPNAPISDIPTGTGDWQRP